MKAAPLAASTKENYWNVLRVHVVPVIGDVGLNRLKPTDVVRVLTTMQDKGLAGSTQRTVKTALGKALDAAVVNGLIHENPAAKVPRPRNPRKEARHLTPEEAAIVMREAAALRYGKALLLALLTGMRRGEIVTLTWDRVDLDRGEVRVRRGSPSTDDTKTEDSWRTVPLGPVAVAMLTTHKAKQAEERLRAGNLWEDHCLVFATEFGNPVDPRNLLRAVKIAARKAGLPEKDRYGRGIGVHTLRHSSATAQLLAGVSDIVVAQNHGHSDPEHHQGALRPRDDQGAAGGGDCRRGLPRRVVGGDVALHRGHRDQAP